MHVLYVYKQTTIQSQKLFIVLRQSYCFSHTHADVKASVLKVLLANRIKDNILHIFKVGDAFAHCKLL